MKINGVTIAGGTGGGTVTTVSVVSANGLNGVVSNATTTPAITLSTTITGILKGNGTAISAATPGTDYVTDTSTTTLTNKRITVRSLSVASDNTPTINTDNLDFYILTGQNANISTFTTNLTGSPTEGQLLWISITDNGTPQSITWGSRFESSSMVILPTTTVSSTRMDIGFVWNTTTSAWRCIALA